MTASSANSLRLLVAVAVCATIALGGCEKDDTRTTGPGTPEECWKQFAEAVRGRDHARVYDLLSTHDHASIDAELTQFQVLDPADLAAAAAELGVGPGEVRKLKPRAYFIAVCDRAADESPDLLAGASVEKTTADDTRATLTIRTAGGETRQFHMVREQLPTRFWQDKKSAWFVVIYQD